MPQPLIFLDAGHHPPARVYYGQTELAFFPIAEIAMKTRMRIFLAMLFISAFPSAHAQNPRDIDKYTPGPDSKPQPGVPQGKIHGFNLENSKIFPGTSRHITVYVPAQYDGHNPACVYVGLDSLSFGVPTVFDNLIHKGEMPVTIAIGVSSGTVPSVNTKDNPRFNRSFEFDGMNDALARFLIEEVFPEVEKRPTPDGHIIKLSTNPNDRCTGGGSTGGVAAFTLAWERPDQFRRVFSAIGTFVGMRGADAYPVLVRKTEPKPIRVYQQDGSNDQWMGGPEVGDWWMSNQTLERSLAFAGYDHMFAWGTGSHSGKHADAIFPDAMRFLWKDWPKTIEPRIAQSQNVILKATLDPNSTWQLVPEAGNLCTHLAVNPKGEVHFQDIIKKLTLKIDVDGKIIDAADNAFPMAFAFNADGRIYSREGVTQLTVTNKGLIYATEADKVWLIDSEGKKTKLDEGLKMPWGIALSPDGLWLAVMELRTHRGYSYRVKSDGTVDMKQAFYWAHVPDWADDNGAGGMCMDRDGHPYVATSMGVQIFDRNGRSRGILPMPTGEAAEAVTFGGAKFDTLFATSGGKLYKRHMKAIGAPGFLAPIKLPPWGGG